MCPAIVTRHTEAPFSQHSSSFIHTGPPRSDGNGDQAHEHPAAHWKPAGRFQNVNTHTRVAGSRRRGSAQTRASRRTRSGTVADSEEERSALPTAGTWPAIEAGHRDSLLYSGGKNPRDSAATQASAHHHTHHIEADGTHTSKQDTAAQHTRTASHTTPSSPKLPGGSPAPQSVVALHSMRSGSKEAGSAAGP